MDVLLLHTAISLENIKEIKQAKLFYEMVISKYSTSNSAVIAKKKLATLK
jgi:TolA-binding protein